MISVPQVVAGGVGVQVPPWDGKALESGTNAAVVSSENGVPACAVVTPLMVQPPSASRSIKFDKLRPGSS